MRFIDFIIVEARKNPELNVKASINSAIQTAYKTASALPGTDILNSFISFTAIDKLGVNPKSIHATPIGIYAYLIRYASESIEDGIHPSSGLPYAGEQPFANIFTVAPGSVVMDLVSMTNGEAQEIYEKIAKLIGPPYRTTLNQLIADASTEADVGDVIGGQVWFVMMMVVLSIYKAKQGRDSAVKWNWLLRTLGYDVVIDTGKGIIHENEYTQALILHTGVIGKVTRVVNRYSPVPMEKSRLYGEAVKRIKHYITTGTLTTHVWDDVVRDELPEWPQLIELVKDDDRKILAAINARNMKVLAYLTPPSRTVVAAALQLSPAAAAALTVIDTNTINMIAANYSSALGFLQQSKLSADSLDSCYRWIDSHPDQLLLFPVGMQAKWKQRSSN